MPNTFGNLYTNTLTPLSLPYLNIKQDLKNQIDKLLEDNPENTHKQIIQWDTDWNKFFPVDEINLWELINTIEISIC